jgi:hypothetical protein
MLTISISLRKFCLLYLLISIRRHYIRKQINCHFSMCASHSLPRMLPTVISWLGSWSIMVFLFWTVWTITTGVSHSTLPGRLAHIYQSNWHFRTSMSVTFYYPPFVSWALFCFEILSLIIMRGCKFNASSLFMVVQTSFWIVYARAVHFTHTNHHVSS